MLTSYTLSPTVVLLGIEAGLAVVCVNMVKLTVLVPVPDDAVYP